MWHVRLVVLLLLNALVILFAIANLRQTVVIRWFSPYSSGTPMSLTAALLGAYLLGILTMLFLSALRELRLRRRYARMEQQVNAMREELNALRTAPFEAPLETRAPVVHTEE